MDRTVAYAVWRNPKSDNQFEVVGVPVKTLREKVTLLIRHPAFPGVRLDVTMVDFDPAAALRRYATRHATLAEHHQQQLARAAGDAQIVNELLESGAYQVRVLEGEQWEPQSSN